MNKEAIIKEFRKNKWMADEFVMIDTDTCNNLEEFILKALSKQEKDLLKEIENIQTQIGKVKMWSCESVITMLEVLKQNI